MSWKTLNIDGSEAEKRYGVGKLTAKLLTASKLDEEQTGELLSGDTRLSTSKAQCIQKACQRILLALDRNEKVFVAGDYDADGICSTAIMKKTLDLLHIVNGYYIPDRLKEGYGLRSETVDKVHENGYTLIITVDNGVKAHEALQRAASYGMDTIVTDHHIIEDKVEADIVVHPDYMESEYEYLSGAGVALEVSRNLVGEQPALNVFCAVALIGDVMPLWKENRKIIRYGLDCLKTGRPKSLAKMLYPGSAVDETAIAFSIVPKLNAVGRMSDISNANTLVPYLLSENDSLINSYSIQLEQVNNARKKLSEKETETAISMIDDQPLPVIQDDSFHEGICGLVAGRLAAQFCRPVIVMTSSDSECRGSGRSVPGLDLFAMMTGYDKYRAFGGHSQAVGFSIDPADTDSLNDYLQEKMRESGFVYEEPVQEAIIVSMQDISFDSISDMQIMSPYPKDMVNPYFAVEDAVIKEVKRTPKVTKFILNNGKTDLEAVVYARKNLKIPENPSRFMGTLSISRWRGRTSLQMTVEGIE